MFMSILLYVSDSLPYCAALATVKECYSCVSEQKETESLGALRSRVLACLSLASVKELSSIVFPAVATGILGYPAEKEARTVLSATREFFTRMPFSSLKRVTFVCHRGNLEVAKVRV